MAKIAFRVMMVFWFALAIVSLVVLSQKDDATAATPSPAYSALVMPSNGLPPLELDGISRYTYSNNTVTLTIDGEQMTFVGVPVIIYPSAQPTMSPNAGPSLLPESRSFGSPDLRGESSLLELR